MVDGAYDCFFATVIYFQGDIFKDSRGVGESMQELVFNCVADIKANPPASTVLPSGKNYRMKSW